MNLSELLAIGFETATLAWWGAILSTILAFIKIWEFIWNFWKNRFRLDIDVKFTPPSVSGNEIIIRNSSPYSILLKNWEVFYGSGRWPFRKELTVCCKHYGNHDITIAPISSFVITCNNESYFLRTTPN